MNQTKKALLQQQEGFNIICILRYFFCCDRNVTSDASSS